MPHPALSIPEPGFFNSLLTPRDARARRHRLETELEDDSRCTPLRPELEEGIDGAHLSRNQSREARAHSRPRTGHEKPSTNNHQILEFVTIPDQISPALDGTERPPTPLARKNTDGDFRTYEKKLAQPPCRGVDRS